MTVNTDPFVRAFLTFRSSLLVAVDYQNPNYTNSAIHRERLAQLEKARESLLAQIPAESKTDPNVGIAEVLGKLAPKNADDVALQRMEWEKVSSLIRAGRSLEALILSAQPLRLAAIANWIKVSDEALTSGDSEGVAEEVRALVYSRLVDLGVPEAIAARDVVEDANVVSAWRDVLLGAVEGAASVGALGRLYKVDPAGYAALGIEETLSRDVALDEKVQRLDRLSQSEHPAPALRY
ncbi:hypothetical protein [Microbacterium sp. 22296]|uniref:hypothetical protein n=1 Tax=Microbacterium sp. 22296 TaxID=3453903 RepID=UPI003F84C9B6